MTLYTQYTTRPQTSIFSAERPISAMKFLRMSFFALLAYDLWLISLSHAPRYGAGGFNVAHLNSLDQWVVSPTPSLIGSIYLAAGAVAIWVSVGLTQKVGVALCALSYTFAYFWSQADSYQHHYLLCLILLLCTGEPWRAERAEGLERAEQSSQRGLSIDALMWQMAFIYAWTAMAKCEPVWLSGSTLSKMVSNPEVRQSVESWGATFGLSVSETFQWSAWGVMLGEWFAAIAFLLRPLRTVAFFIIPWFHIMVEWVGFDIELFSYYMLLLNIALLSPAVFWRPMERLSLRCEVKRDDEADKKGNEGSISLFTRMGIYSSFMSVGGALLCALCTYYMVSQVGVEGAWLGGLLGGGVTFISIAFARRGQNRSMTRYRYISVCISFIVALSGHHYLQSQVSSPDFLFKYYRMWGGDLKRRGESEAALMMYERANQVQAPNLPARFIPAGELALKLGKIEIGLGYLQEGATRRVNELERLSATLLNGASDLESRRGFERAARSAQSAQRKLYRAYRQRSDSRAPEAQASLEAISQMIDQVRRLP